MALGSYLLAGFGAGCSPQAAAVIASADALRIEEATVVLDAVVVDASGGVLDLPVTWTTSDPAVVTVDRAGRVTAVHSGSATVRATAGTLSDEVLVEVDLFSYGTLGVAVVLTEGERAPLSWSARDDAGGPWDGAVACRSSQAGVVAVAESEVVAVAPGRATVMCAAGGGSFDAEVGVLPAEWSAFAWRRATTVELPEGIVVPFSREEVPSNDWIRLTEAFSWRARSGRPAYVVLAELLDLSVAFSCHRGEMIVVTQGDEGPQITKRIDLGRRCVGVPPCAECGATRSDTLAPPRFTAAGLVAGGELYVWRDGALVQSP